jgi:uncharacterized protein (TIGR02680 family)
VETLAGPNPLDLAVAAAGRAASGDLARADAELRGQLREAECEADRLDDAIARLEAGEHEVPPPAYTRDPAARDEHGGAPLWQVVDFRPDVSPADRAGLEAALEAAGILDAWVSPAGELLAPGTLDVMIDPSGRPPVTGTTLNDVLRPAIDRESCGAATLAEEAVKEVLTAIALTDEGDPVSISPDGSFRHGILRGAWQKATATFIGHGAREQARRLRLAELQAERIVVAGRTKERGENLLRLAERRAKLEAELAAVPGDADLREAHAALGRLESELARATERVVIALGEEREAKTAMQTADTALRSDAEDLGLPVDRAMLEFVESSLQTLRETLAALWQQLLVRDRDRQAAREASSDLERARAELSEAGERLETAEREHATCRERHATLEEAAGAAIAELQRRLVAVASALGENDRLRKQADDRRADAQREEGKQAGRRELLQQELQEATERRVAAVEALQRFAGTGLIAVALEQVELPGSDEEWNVTAALRVARHLEQELATVKVDDSAWQGAQRRANDDLGALADALRRHGNSASALLREEGIMVEVTFRGHSMSVPALASALTDEVTDSQRLLDEREREILENHLINEVASSLQELIADAERQLVRINGELADRPTSTGMQLRLRWVVDDDGPPGLVEARERLLRQSADAWSEQDRAAVGGFLQARIQEVRANDIAGTWIEYLTDALDYRKWHRFTVDRRQSGTWRSATGPSSGGERVLAASIPMFAAASSYYASADNVRAPRLVMLDEAFAGVDDHARARCLGLLAAFDLDVVMTSEREWGCYPEVPGLAIAQLVRADDVPAVLVTHWEWDGFECRRIEQQSEPVIAAVAGGEAGRAEGPGLWET